LAARTIGEKEVIAKKNPAASRRVMLLFDKDVITEYRLRKRLRQGCPNIVISQLIKHSRRSNQGVCATTRTNKGARFETVADGRFICPELPQHGGGA
jgi:hypothetical protein